MVEIKTTDMHKCVQSAIIVQQETNGENRICTPITKCKVSHVLCF